MNTVPRPDLPSGGTIVVLNGVSSSGKSSLARELQASLSRAYLHVQLDTFREMEPPGYFSLVPPDLRVLRVAALCRAMNATAAEYARHGQNVLLDHVLPPEGWMYLAEDLAGFSVLLVGVHCSVEVLDARERSRGDRPLGLAASQAGQIHTDRVYDFEVDTSHQDSLECAAHVRGWLESGPVANAFRNAERESAAV